MTPCDFPTLSFKDRVVATALAAARRFGFKTVGCSSTGNLANAVAAQGAQQGFDTCVFIPADLEPAKVLNTAVYGAAHHPHQRQLRSRQPALHADRRQLPLGLGEREPAALLRRRLEDAWLRNRRATWLGTSRQRGGPDGWRLADRQNRESVLRTGAPRLGGAQAREVLWRAGHRLLARLPTP